eukprot:g22964.t1
MHARAEQVYEHACAQFCLRRKRNGGKEGARSLETRRSFVDSSLSHPIKSVARIFSPALCFGLSRPWRLKPSKDEDLSSHLLHSSSIRQKDS